MEHELKSLNLLLSEAEKKHDLAFFEKHLSEQLLFRRASGMLNTKQQFLEALGGTQYLENNPEIHSLNVTADDRRAVVEVLVQAKVLKADGITEGRYMNLRFWERQDATWQLLSWYNYKL